MGRSVLLVLARIDLIFFVEDLYGATFWVFDVNSGDSTLMFSVVSEQCLYWTKDFPISHAALPVRSWRCTRIQEGMQPGQLIRWPKGYSVTYSIILSKKTGKMFQVMVFVFPRNHYTW